MRTSENVLNRLTVGLCGADLNRLRDLHAAHQAQRQASSAPQPCPECAGTGLVLIDGSDLLCTMTCLLCDDPSSRA